MLAELCDFHSTSFSLCDLHILWNLRSCMPVDVFSAVEWFKCHFYMFVSVSMLNPWMHRFCGQEYERRQEMPAASLAYKCMEVAYMRVVYCKQSSTSRDLTELQATLHKTSQGNQMHCWLVWILRLVSI